MRTPLALLRLAAFALLLLAPGLAAAGPVAPLPSPAGGKSALAVRIVGYTGGVNGEMVVEIRNTGSKAEVFGAQGLYFVPDGNPEVAPQRLGAAGPFRLQDDAAGSARDKLALAPRATAQVRLQVFCIDSHRSAPTAQHSFHLGKERLPRELRAQIESRAKAALGAHGGSMPAAKAAIQSEVWHARDSKWIRLDGERRHEKGGPELPFQERLRRERRPLPRQQ